VAEERSALESLKDGLSILNAQQEMASAGAATGNPRNKGVVVDSKSGSKANKAKAVSATLTSNEKSRYENIFKILKDVIDPGPEAGKSSTTSRVKKEGNVSGAAKEATGNKTAEKDGKSFIDKLLGGLALMPFLKMLWGYLKKQIPRLLKKLKDVAKKALRAALKTAKKLLSSIGRAALKAFRNAGTFIGKVFDKLKNSKVVQALKGAFTSAFKGLGAFFTSIKDFVVNAAKNVVKSIPGGQKALDFLKKAGGFVKDTVVKGVAKTSQAARFVGGKVVQAKDTIIRGTKAVAGKAGQAFQTAKGAIINTAKGAKGMIAKHLVPRVKPVLKSIAKRIPIIGGAIEAAFTTHDIKKYANDPENGVEVLKKKIGDRVVEGIGGVGGGALAAAIVSPLPILSLPAYFLGDMLGRKVAEIVSDNFDTTNIGGMVMNAFNISPAAAATGVTPEINDGIITHGGQTVRINSKDDVLALKTGGPLDRLMKPSSLDIGSAQVFDDMRELGKAQLQTLVAIKNGINALVAKGGQDSSSPSKIDLSPNKLSDAFFKSEQYT
tara:strand:- start:506 stop:2155 length:1650 start_codon:yes stop_codon:yes gene_type:complete